MLVFFANSCRWKSSQGVVKVFLFFPCYFAEIWGEVSRGWGGGESQPTSLKIHRDPASSVSPKTHLLIGECRDWCTCKDRSNVKWRILTASHAHWVASLALDLICNFWPPPKRASSPLHFAPNALLVQPMWTPRRHTQHSLPVWSCPGLGGIWLLLALTHSRL